MRGYVEPLRFQRNSPQIETNESRKPGKLSAIESGICMMIDVRISSWAYSYASRPVEPGG
jgi:hypothetical protein